MIGGPVDAAPLNANLRQRGFASLLTEQLITVSSCAVASGPRDPAPQQVIR